MDKEEKLLAEAYDQGLIKLEDPSADLMGMLKEAGDKTLEKDKRINIRLSSHDLLGIQQKAAQKGIPYQAFISGLIHQYVEGDLVEESHAKYRRKWLVYIKIYLFNSPTRGILLRRVNSWILTQGGVFLRVIQSRFKELSFWD